MNKLFDFSEHKEIPTEEPVDMSPNAIEYYTELEGTHYFNNTSFSTNISYLDRINSRYNTTSSLVNNLREYGINPQVANYIKSNYNTSSINLLINDEDSLQYGKNTKLANEVAYALEAINWKKLKDDLLTFLKKLWDKFIEFIKNISKSAPVLKMKINLACKKYKNLQDKEISSVQFNSYNGIPQKSVMVKFVNNLQQSVYSGLSKYKLNSEDISSIKAETDKMLTEFNGFYNWILSDAGGYEKSKAKDLGHANIEYKDLVSNSSDSFYSIAFKAVTWIENYTKTVKTLELNTTLVESYLSKLDEDDLSNINVVNDCREVITDYSRLIQVVQLIISKNIELINTYCTLLNNMG